MGARLDKLKRLLHSRKGRNAVTFMAFVCLSAVLWMVLALNEETQQDLRCTVKITNVPDSVTRITPIPEAVNVSVRARGTQLLRYWWSAAPQISLDYRVYNNGNKIQFGETAMRAFFRNIVGAGSQVLSVTPDTLNIAFTTSKGILLPVRQDVKIISAPQYTLVKKPQLLTDSVMLYFAEGNNRQPKAVATKAITLTDVRKSQTIKVPLLAGANARAIPDSVEIAFEVEPLISKMRKVPVTPVNVPANMRLIAVPSQVEVYYMVPMSMYKRADADPRFRIEADYAEIAGKHTEKIPIELVNVPRDFTNVYLSADSVDYILEQK